MWYISYPRHQTAAVDLSAVQSGVSWTMLQDPIRLNLVYLHYLGRITELRQDITTQFAAQLHTVPSTKHNKRPSLYFRRIHKGYCLWADHVSSPKTMSSLDPADNVGGHSRVASVFRAIPYRSGQSGSAALPEEPLPRYGAA